MSNLIHLKVNQAIEILKEKRIDLWLTFVRETSAGGDPVIPLIYGHDLTWQSALMITRKGETYAILGHFEAETARNTGAYQTVLPYHDAISRSLLHTLERIYPRQIALNFSRNDVHADGLSHGLYQLLIDYFDDTPWEQRIVSAESIIGALRGRKLPEEIARIRAAIKTTEEIYERTFATIQEGMTEREISQFMQAQLAEFGVEAAWELEHCPIVGAGRRLRSVTSARPTPRSNVDKLCTLILASGRRVTVQIFKEWSTSLMGMKKLLPRKFRRDLIPSSGQLKRP